VTAHWHWEKPPAVVDWLTLLRRRLACVVPYLRSDSYAAIMAMAHQSRQVQSRALRRRRRARINRRGWA
jgi:hypothetical protein